MQAKVWLVVNRQRISLAVFLFFLLFITIQLFYGSSICHDETSIISTRFSTVTNVVKVPLVRSELKPNLIITGDNGKTSAQIINVMISSFERVSTGSGAQIKYFMPDIHREDIQPILQRFSHLVEFIPYTAEQLGNGDYMQVQRFNIWKSWLDTVDNKTGQPNWKSYNRVMNSDLDVVFQIDPFLNIELPEKGGLAMFAEYRHFSIGDCLWHRRWFQECRHFWGDVWENEYHDKARICAGTTFGTSEAFHLYIDMMASSLNAQRMCNDQAMHIYLYYSGQLSSKMDVILYTTEEGPLGTVGSTPVIQWNEFGDVVNDQGQIQSVVHQFKHHKKFNALVSQRYPYFDPTKSPKCSHDEKQPSDRCSCRFKKCDEDFTEYAADASPVYRLIKSIGVF